MSGPETTVRLADMPEGMNVAEVAMVLRVAPVTVYQAIQRGELYAIKLGRRVIVPRSEVARLLKVGVGG